MPGTIQYTSIVTAKDRGGGSCEVSGFSPSFISYSVNVQLRLKNFPSFTREDVFESDVFKIGDLKWSPMRLSICRALELSLNLGWFECHEALHGACRSMFKSICIRLILR